MFSHRFLRGGLEKYGVSIYLTPLVELEADFTFHWLENEDYENVGARFQAQFQAVLASSKASTEASREVVHQQCRTLVMHPAGDSPDVDVILQILAALAPYGPYEIVFSENHVSWCSSSAALPYLQGLNTMCLSNCNLTAVPDVLFTLVQLKGLDLSSNKLTAIPVAVGDLAALECLDASNNLLTALPGVCACLNLIMAIDAYRYIEMGAGSTIQMACTQRYQFARHVVFIFRNLYSYVGRDPRAINA